MKVEDKRNKVPFGTIEIGDCFEYDGNIYMKLIRHEVDYSTFKRQYYNAVELERGHLRVFHGDESVWPVDAKVVIE